MIKKGCHHFGLERKILMLGANEIVGCTPKLPLLVKDTVDRRGRRTRHRYAHLKVR